MIAADASEASKIKERREARRSNVKLNKASTPKLIQASVKYSCDELSSHNNKARILPDTSPTSKMSVLNFVLIVDGDCMRSFAY